MRVLFDQGTPAPLRHALAPHKVSTVFAFHCPGTIFPEESMATSFKPAGT